MLTLSRNFFHLLIFIINSKHYILCHELFKNVTLFCVIVFQCITSDYERIRKFFTLLWFFFCKYATNDNKFSSSSEHFFLPFFRIVRLTLLLKYQLEVNWLHGIRCKLVCICMKSWEKLVYLIQQFNALIT